MKTLKRSRVAAFILGLLLLVNLFSVLKIESFASPVTTEDGQWAITPKWTLNSDAAQNQTDIDFRPGDTLNYSMNFQKQGSGQFNGDEVFTVYVRTEFYSGLPDHNLALNNPVLASFNGSDGNPAVRIFDAASVVPAATVSREISGKSYTYYQYDVKFNKVAYTNQGDIFDDSDYADSVKAAFDTMNTVNVQFSLSWKSAMETIARLVPIIVESGSTVLFGQEIVHTNPDPVVPVNEPVTRKHTYGVFRANGTGDISSYKAMPYTTTTVLPGDLVVFEIKISGTEGTVSSVIDELPSGYVLVAPGTVGPWSSPDPNHNNNGRKLNLNWSAVSDAYLTGGRTSPDYTAYKYTFPAPVDLAAAGGKTYVYIWAVVKENFDLTGHLTNTAYSTGEFQGSGFTTPGSSVSYHDMQTEKGKFYDVAAVILYSEGINSAGWPMTTEVLNAAVGHKFYAGIAVINQGTIGIRNPEVRVYIPEGIGVDTAGNTYTDNLGNVWNRGADVTNNDDWGTLQTWICNVSPAIDTKHQLNNGVIVPGDGHDNDNYVQFNGNMSNAYMLDLPLVVKAGTFRPEQYYSAVEVSYFADGADPGKNTASMPAIADKDSTPDNDPFNDLAGTLVSSGAKEIDNRVTGHALQFPAQDEDDFDFAALKVVSSAAKVTDVITKRRVATTNPSEIQTALDGWSSPGAPYVPVSSDADGNGVIINADDNYLIYEIWLNKDGLQSMYGAKFEDQLPKGLRYMPADDTNGKVNNEKIVYGQDSYMRISSYAGNPRVPADDGSGDMVISHAEGMYIYSVQFGGVDNDPGTYQYVLTPDHITTTLSDDRTKYTMEWPKTGSPDDEKYHKAYKIVFLAVIDKTKIDYSNIYANTAKFKYNSIEKSAVESDQVYWKADSGSAYVKKFVQTDNNPAGSFTFPIYAGGTPHRYQDGSGINRMISSDTLSVSYAVRVRSGTGSPLRASDINVYDSIADPAAIDSVTNIRTEGFKAAPGTLYALDGDLQSPVALTPGSEAVSASYNDFTGMLHITNSAVMPAMQAYYVYFTVNYKAASFKAGQVIKNTVTGSTVSSVIPLNIRVVKQDESGNALSGYEFKAYYAKAGFLGGTSYFPQTTAEADMPAPSGSAAVKNTAGDDVTLNSLSPSFSFIPPDYLTKSDNSWYIVLTETVAPDGYSSNAGSQYVLHVVKAADGTLSIDPVTSASVDVITSVADGKTTATIRNNRDNRNIAAPQYDLALQKWVAKVNGADVSPAQTGRESGIVPTTVSPGDLVTFNIRITNQSDDVAQPVGITDYLGYIDPAHGKNTLEFVSASTAPENRHWTITPEGYYYLDWATYCGDKQISGLIARGDANAVIVSIVLKVPVGAANNLVIRNIAEIDGIKDGGGADVPDIDSTNNSNASDNGTMKDNVIDEHYQTNGTVDSSKDHDASDFAEVVVTVPPNPRTPDKPNTTTPTPSASPTPTPSNTTPTPLISPTPTPMVTPTPPPYSERPTVPIDPETVDRGNPPRYLEPIPPEMIPAGWHEVTRVDDNGQIYYTIEEDEIPQTELPNTGGVGIGLTALLGGLLIAAGLAVRFKKIEEDASK